MSLRLVFALVLLHSAVAIAQATRPTGEVPSGTELTVRHLHISSDAPGIELAGQLTMPARRAGPLPAVVLVTGAGPHTREEVTFGSPLFRMIADYLASRGVAVLSSDARGFGFSTGPEESKTTPADRALDTQAWLKELRKQPEIDPNRIGIIGHSEGAVVAMMVAADTDLANYIILMGAPGQGGGQVWINQRLANLQKQNAPQATLDAARTAFEKFVALAGKGFSSDAEYYGVGKEILRAHGVPEDKVTEKLVDQVVGELREPHSRFFLVFDPATVLPRVNEPVFAVWGELDEQIPPSRNAPMFENARDAGKQNVVVKRLSEEDHFFLRREGLAPGGKHELGRMHVAPALLTTLEEWITTFQPGQPTRGR